MPANTATLPRPAAELRAYALAEARLPSHRKLLTYWLHELDLGSVDELLDALGGRHRESTTLLLQDYRRGAPFAVTVLVAAKTVMLSSIARQAPGDTLEERFQVTLDAFLSCALPRVHPDHRFADEQLYWVTLRTVTRPRNAPWVDPDFDLDSVAGGDVVADMDEHLTADAILDWAMRTGLITDLDRQALLLRFGGPSVVPVREVAAHLGVGERRLETRLRRAIAGIKAAVVSQRVALERSCVAASWALRDASAVTPGDAGMDAEMGSEGTDNGAAA